MVKKQMCSFYKAECEIGSQACEKSQEEGCSEAKALKEKSEVNKT